MGLFDKIFGKKEPASRSAPTGLAPVDVPATIKVSESDGRVTEMPREEWRKRLPDTFKKCWDAPDDLARLISNCLRDGFAAESLEGAQWLNRVDPQARRGAELLGVTLLQLKRFGEAEKVIKEALQRYGENGSLLTNLAKTYAGQGDPARAERALWRALEVDPNQDNGLLQYTNTQRERGGPKAEAEAFRRVAALPSSWRAQLWLARQALHTKDVPAALALYQEALNRLKPVTADVLAQISGDLGDNGLFKELTEICGPLFDAKEHGLRVGDNLIKAYVELRDAPGAQRVLEQLSAQQRPDWSEQLLSWQREIDKLDKGYAPVEKAAKAEEPPATPASEPRDAPVEQAAQVEAEWLALDGPIWARGTPFSEMLPSKAEDAVKVAFFCGSAEVPPPGNGGQMISPTTDAAGRFSRGLPLFLAERIHIKTTASVVTCVPWSKQEGFVLAGEPWTPSALPVLEKKPDFAVFLHILGKQDPWQMKFSIVRLTDRKAVVNWEQPVGPKDPAAAINAITKRIVSELQAATKVAIQPASDSLFPPTVTMLPNYLAALEQALAVYCSAIAPEGQPFPCTERDMIDGMLDLCLRESDNATMRMLLLSAVECEMQVHPDLIKEYRERLERLQREHPLRRAAQGLTDAALARIYAE